MNDSEVTQDGATTTEQIAAAGTADSAAAGTAGSAAAGTADSEDGMSPGQHPPEDVQAEQRASAAQAAAVGGSGLGEQPPAQLLANDELQSILMRWKDIQAEFVDEPRRAVQDADALVADLMQRLARMFASEREQLESRWASGDDVSTEDLRHSLRRYRSFFERLLAA
jgi:hypothetical protein